MRRAELTLCYDRHPDSPRHLWVTKDGLKFTQEQWELMKFMERLEKKLDKMRS